MLMALVLGNRNVSDVKVWKILCKRFFAYYRMNILSWYGYEKYRPVKKPIIVNNPDLLIAIISAMKQAGMFGDCSCEKLAEGVGHVFELGYAPSTLLQRIKGEGMEYYTEVADFFEKIK